MTIENDKRKGELSAFDKAIRLCEIAKLRAALEASEARIKELDSPWLPINSHYKSVYDKKAFLVFNGDNLCAYIAYWDNDREYLCHFDGNGYGFHHPEALTHWMPLPKPPATEDKKDEN